MSLKYKIPLILALSFGYALSYGQSFVHPGLLNSKADLERMKDGVAKKTEPIYSGYEVFSADPQSGSTYKMQGPLAEVSRNPTVGQGAYDSDANAAYHNAIMWYITGNKAYAEESKEIINAWSRTLKSITGKDAVLMAGLGPFKMINAAEIIRYTNAGWSADDIKQAEKNFKEVVYPVLKDFAPFANGNWDAAALKTVMAVAIFCNDRQMYERTLEYYVAGCGDGALTNYIINEDGQCQESGRDQSHTQLGIAHLGDCCEMAWHQGIDLYGYADNRLLKGFEYTARYNLGNEVLYTPAMDRTGKYEHAEISSNARGRLRPVYEQIFNHYVNEMRQSAPYTQQAAEKLRPELKGQPGADHPGFGTLLYSIPAKNSGDVIIKMPPVTPAGVIARGAATSIDLTWIAPIDARGYIIKRASKASGPYTTISTSVAEPKFTDKQVTKGTIYYYSIIGVNQYGKSAGSLPIKIAAGLPQNWGCAEVGNASAKCTYQYDGNTFTLEGTGKGINEGTADQFQFVFSHLAGDGTITARFMPPVSSQFTELGLMIRDTLTNGAATAALLIHPDSTKDVELPIWKFQFLAKPSAGEPLVKTSDLALTEPYVKWGRLMEPYWLKLSRKGTLISAAISSNGRSWKIIGVKELPMKKQVFIGIAAASVVNGVSTTVKFDHVIVSR
jgi:hypothetical protein